MKIKKAKFIVVEGGEGSGKSTLMITLKEVFGDSVLITREPGGSPYAEAIRETTLKNPLAKTAPVETTLCLMFAARFDNTKNSIAPALRIGLPVIADRFDGSSYAYNVMAQSDGELEEIFWNLRGQLIVLPDLYIYLDVNPEEGVRRAGLRNKSLFKSKRYDHFDDRKLVFHRKVQSGYKRFLKHVPHVIIDANPAFEVVEANFIAEIKKQLCRHS